MSEEASVIVPDTLLIPPGDGDNPPEGEKQSQPNPDVVAVPEGNGPAEVNADLQMIQSQLASAQEEVENLQSLTEKLLLMKQEPPPMTEEQLEAARQRDIEAFENDPEAFIQSKVAEALKSRPELAEATSALDELRGEQAIQELEKAVPDYKDLFANPGFRVFMQKNPVYQRVLQEANASYDVDTIAGILNHFKTQGGVDEKGNPVNGGGKGGNKGAGRSRIFSRSELKKLSVQDPVAYAKLGKEISLAYKEGRVR